MKNIRDLKKKCFNKMNDGFEEHVAFVIYFGLSKNLLLSDGSRKNKPQNIWILKEKHCLCCHENCVSLPCQDFLLK